MKRFLAIALVFVFVFGMTSCVVYLGGDEPPSSEKTGDGTEALAAPVTELYPVKYVRADGYHEDVEYPYAVKIGSATELGNYIEEMGKEYHFGHTDTTYPDAPEGFLDAVAGCDEEFFVENMLVMAVLEEGSGSNRHELMGVTGEDVILIKRIVPEAGTCDMAAWHIILEVPRERAEGRDFEVEYYGEDNREFVLFSQDCVTMTARLPDGWSYEERPLVYDEEAAKEYESFYEYAKAKFLYFGLEFFPEENPDVRLRLYYWARFPGVCGTGLTVKETTLGGHAVTQHFYGGSDVWSMSFFKNTAGDYTLEFAGGKDSYRRYEADILELVESFELGDHGTISEEEAIYTAKKFCTVEYDTVRDEFDFTGLWRVNFSTSDTAGGDQTVILYSWGNLYKNVYGE